MLTKNKIRKSKRQKRIVNPVRRQTHLLWGLPSQEGNPIV